METTKFNKKAGYDILRTIGWTHEAAEGFVEMRALAEKVCGENNAKPAEEKKTTNQNI